MYILQQRYTTQNRIFKRFKSANFTDEWNTRWFSIFCCCCCYCCPLLSSSHACNIIVIISIIFAIDCIEKCCCCWRLRLDFVRPYFILHLVCTQFNRVWHRHWQPPRTTNWHLPSVAYMSLKYILETIVSTFIHRHYSGKTGTLTHTRTHALTNSCCLWAAANCQALNQRMLYTIRLNEPFFFSFLVCVRLFICYHFVVRIKYTYVCVCVCVHS